MRRNQDTGQVRKSWVGKKPQLCPPPITSLCKTPRGKHPRRAGKSRADVFPGSWRKSELLGWALAAPRTPLSRLRLLAHILLQQDWTACGSTTSNAIACRCDLLLGMPSLPLLLGNSYPTFKTQLSAAQGRTGEHAVLVTPLEF